MYKLCYFGWAIFVRPPSINLCSWIMLLIEYCINLRVFFTRAAPEVVEKPGDNSLSRLKMLYIQAKELSESEVAYVDTCILCYLTISVWSACYVVIFLLVCYHSAAMFNCFFLLGAVFPVNCWLSWMRWYLLDLLGNNEEGWVGASHWFHGCNLIIVTSVLYTVHLCL